MSKDLVATLDDRSIRMKASCITVSLLLGASGTTPAPSCGPMWSQFTVTHVKVHK